MLSPHSTAPGLEWVSQSLAPLPLSHQHDGSLNSRITKLHAGPACTDLVRAEGPQAAGPRSPRPLPRRRAPGRPRTETARPGGSFRDQPAPAAAGVHGRGLPR